jgi:hypothetical protein
MSRKPSSATARGGRATTRQTASVGKKRAGGQKSIHFSADATSSTSSSSIGSNTTTVSDSSSSDSDTDHEDQVLELPIANSRVKKIMGKSGAVSSTSAVTEQRRSGKSRGRSSTKSSSSASDTGKPHVLRNPSRDDDSDDGSGCDSCGKLRDRLRELRAKVKGSSADEEPKRVSLSVPAIDRDGKRIRFVNIPGRVCDWDTEPFEWEPTMLPTGMVGGNVIMTGYFCSSECSAAHNLYRMNDSSMWKRKNWIDKMESIRRGEPTVVTPASHPNTMEKFGGMDSAKEWRRRNTCGRRTYRPIPATIVPVATILEADQMGLSKATNDSSSHLVLKRETPLNPQSSLERSMGLKTRPHNEGDSDNDI